jgi:hypothetical protein
VSLQNNSTNSTNVSFSTNVSWPSPISSIISSVPNVTGSTSPLALAPVTSAPLYGPCSPGYYTGSGQSHAQFMELENLNFELGLRRSSSIHAYFC